MSFCFNRRIAWLVLALSVLMMGSRPLNYSEREVHLTGKTKYSRTYRYEISHDYPVFRSAAPLPSLAMLNKHLKDDAVKSSELFLESIREEDWDEGSAAGADSAYSRREFTVTYASEEFVSMTQSYDELYLGSYGSYFGSNTLNFHVPTGLFVEVKDCFAFRRSPEDWIKLVNQEDLLELELEDAMPEDFTLNSDGVSFQFPRHGPVEHRFSWEVVREYFVVSGCIPDEL